jgi:hypothetical protein
MGGRGGLCITNSTDELVQLTLLLVHNVFFTFQYETQCKSLNFECSGFTVIAST